VSLRAGGWRADCKADWHVGGQADIVLTSVEASVDGVDGVLANQGQNPTHRQPEARRRRLGCKAPCQLQDDRYTRKLAVNGLHRLQHPESGAGCCTQSAERHRRPTLPYLTRRISGRYVRLNGCCGVCQAVLRMQAGRPSHRKPPHCCAAVLLCCPLLLACMRASGALQHSWLACIEASVCVCVCTTRPTRPARPREWAYALEPDDVRGEQCQKCLIQHLAMDGQRHPPGARMPEDARGCPRMPTDVLRSLCLHSATRLMKQDEREPAGLEPCQQRGPAARCEQFCSSAVVDGVLMAAGQPSVASGGQHARRPAAHRGRRQSAKQRRPRRRRRRRQRSKRSTRCTSRVRCCQWTCNGRLGCGRCSSSWTAVVVALNLHASSWRIHVALRSSFLNMPWPSIPFEPSALALFHYSIYPPRPPLVCLACSLLPRSTHPLHR
jgi:hypothetical protein